MLGHRLGVYRCERGTYLIEIRLRELRQLFNTLDPSPFHERDLDPAAEEYLVSAAREIGPRRSMLVLHLPAKTEEEEAVDAVMAIRHYFEYRSRHTSCTTGGPSSAGAGCSSASRTCRSRHAERWKRAAARTPVGARCRIASGSGR